MTLATDMAAYKATQKRVTAGPSKILGGASGLLADTIPAACNHITLIPQRSGVYLNVGAAADNGDYLIPTEGVSFTGDAAYFTNIYLYSADNKQVDVFFSSISMSSGEAASLARNDVSSVMYNGGGGTPADNSLQVDTTAATVVASGAAVIAVGKANLIRVWLSNPTASEGCTFKVSQFSNSTPAVANQTGQFERSVGTADHAATIDRAAFGLTTATAHYSKDMIEFSVAPGSYLMLGLSADDAGGTWYARYELRYE